MPTDTGDIGGGVESSADANDAGVAGDPIIADADIVIANGKIRPSQIA